MSMIGITAVLSRAMSDVKFADSLFSDLDKAIIGFDLSAEELADLRKMSRAEFESLAYMPEERKSMAGYGGVRDPPSGLNHNQTTLHTRN